MTKNLLVLRNKTSLLKTKEFFSNNNIDAFYQEISISTPLKVSLENNESDIVIVTSENALSALNDNLTNSSFNKIYFLNSSLSKKAKVCNFIDLSFNNTKKLADYIIKNEESGQKITHLCADNANKNFYTILENSGFKVNAVNAYKTEFVENFNADILENLINKKIKYIMLFSKASLISALELINKNGLKKEDYKFICFSENIAKGVSNLYAKNSNLTEMLNLYKEQK